MIYLKDLDKMKFTCLFESISFLLECSRTLVDTTIRMKNIVKSTVNLFSLENASNLFETIVGEMCKILSCERASIFLYDEERG